MEGHGVVDLYSYSDGKQLPFTRYQTGCPSRIDRIYASADLLASGARYGVSPTSFSDHCLVHVCFGTPSTKGRIEWRRWELNCSLLEDQGFAATCDQAIAHMSAYGSSIDEAWVNFKLDTRHRAISAGARLAFERRREKEMYTRHLNYFMHLESERPGGYKDDIKAARSALNEVLETEYRGPAIRARMRTLVDRERPTRASLAKEKRYVQASTISSLNENGATIRDKCAIGNAFLSYYADLFGTEGATIPSQWPRLLRRLPRVGEESCEALNAPIRISEVDWAIDNLPANKAPGPDGLTAEFYKTFRPHLTALLCKLYNDSHDRNAFPRGFCDTHTILIPKAVQTGQIPSVKDFRPITLANGDYKILAKILARRIQSVIASLVGPHQTCGIKGRSITTNTHIVRTLVEFCERTGEQSAFVQCDLEKAFDRVNHEFLFAVLSHVRLGKGFLEWIRLCYTSVSTRLVLNSELSTPILVRRSVRQGCPMSSLLFSLYLEHLCRLLLDSEDMRGFTSANLSLKVSAYADDLSFFCVDKRSVENAVSHVNGFCAATGASVNLAKCKGVWLGGWATTPESYAGIEWSTVPGTYLGVPLKHSVNGQQLWNAKKGEMQRQVQAWRPRSLSVFCKATVCNLFLVARLWYLLQVLPCAQKNFRAFHRVFAIFIWSSSFEPIRRDYLFRSRATGGLGLVHLYLRTVVSRFVFFRKRQHPFLEHAKHTFLSTRLPDVLITTSPPTQGVPRGFYGEVVRAVQFLCVRFHVEYLFSVSPRKLYHDLVESVLPVPVYHNPVSPYNRVLD